MKKIEDHLLGVFNALTKERDNWKYVTDEQKEKFSFIINRGLSKIYTNESYLVNLKGSSNVLDIWYYFLEKKPLSLYIKKFWSKEVINKENDKYSSKDIDLLINYTNLTKTDLRFLILYFSDEINEELKYIKNLNKKV
jgi:hypothetical protein